MLNKWINKFKSLGFFVCGYYKFDANGTEFQYYHQALEYITNISSKRKVILGCSFFNNKWHTLYFEKIL